MRTKIVQVSSITYDGKMPPPCCKVPGYHKCMESFILDVREDDDKYALVYDIERLRALKAYGIEEVMVSIHDYTDACVEEIRLMSSWTRCDGTCEAP